MARIRANNASGGGGANGIKAVSSFSPESFYTYYSEQINAGTNLNTFVSTYPLFKTGDSSQTIKYQSQFYNGSSWVDTTYRVKVLIDGTEKQITTTESTVEIPPNSECTFQITTDGNSYHNRIRYSFVG